MKRDSEQQMATEEELAEEEAAVEEAPIQNVRAVPQAQLTVDTVGKFCPVPVMEAARAMKEVQAGQVMQVLATDPGVEADFPAWCKATRNKYLGTWRRGEVLQVFVRKAG